MLEETGGEHGIAHFGFEMNLFWVNLKLNQLNL
jgi:hypothetical protein